MRLSWRELAGWLIGWNDSNSEDRKKLDAIERQHIYEDACLKAVVEVFLLREGVYRRRLTHALYSAQESRLAEKVKTNAEPQQGEWVSVWRGR